MIITNEEDIHQFIIESNAIEGIGKYDGDKYFSQHREALEAARECRGILTTTELEKWHKSLMRGILNHTGLRKMNVRVGGRICPDPMYIHYLLQRVCMAANLVKSTGECWEVHHAFECVHPFEDGNGRIGRILLNWCRGKINKPLKMIFKKDAQPYYRYIEKWAGKEGPSFFSSPVPWTNRAAKVTGLEICTH